LHDLANVLVCPVADEHVHVVCCNLAGDDVQLVLSRDLSQNGRSSELGPTFAIYTLALSSAGGHRRLRVHSKSISDDAF
jgi:hypothetical protein